MTSDLAYANGAIYLRERNGKREYFYPNGALKTVETYVRERLEGEVLLYWPNGKMKRRSHFQNGLRHGLDEICK